MSFGDLGRKAVVLLSGGLDSATTAAIAGAEGYQLYALSFNYGQRHGAELEAARRVARHLRVREHRVVDLDPGVFIGSALTSHGGEVPRDRPQSEIGRGIPATYVPARNTLFLSYALAWAEVLDTGNIFIGVNALDFSGYPDCRPQFIDAFQQMANLATRLGVQGSGVVIHAPLIHSSKKDIILKGVELDVDYGLTWSCYDPRPDGAACGRCDACLLRLRGFSDAGLTDPIRYARPPDRAALQVE